MSDPNANSVEYYLEDVANGYYTTVYPSGVNHACDSDAAEWITEHTMENGSLSALADFGQVNFSDAYAGTTADQRLGYWDSYSVHMTSDDGT